jgi:fluoroacetyl-CoA thioesterase
MRPGPPRGETATLEVTVTPEMTARIDGREIHAVYGTVNLAAHVEQVCRAVLEPHLEAGEEGVGAKIELLHRAPVPVGETITLLATVATVAQASLTCEILVRHRDAVVARGSFEQRIVQVADFLAEVDARRTVTRAG